jgi:hypothetical protein
MPKPSNISASRGTFAMCRTICGELLMQIQSPIECDLPSQDVFPAYV